MITAARCELDDLKAPDIDLVLRLYTNARVRQGIGGPKDEQTVRSKFHRWLSADSFSQTWVTRNKAETQVANLKSWCLLERLGMRLEDTIERFGARQTIDVIDNSPPGGTNP